MISVHQGRQRQGTDWHLPSRLSAEAHRAQSGRLGRGGGWRSSQEGLDQSSPRSGTAMRIDEISMRIR